MNIKKLVVASNNAGKIREITQLLAPLGIEVVSQAALGISEAEEPHDTFLENALAKARHAAKQSGLPALADDSGICVHALSGAPGVHSARFAGLPKDDERNNQHLLKLLEPHTDRRAHYVCVMVLMRHGADPQPIIAEAEWHGEVLRAPRGTGGFGYDPYFLIPELGKTGAELSLEHKNEISHRGRALRALTEKLGTYPGDVTGVRPLSGFRQFVDFEPYRLSGTVYGVLMNHRPALEALRDVVSQPPYKAAPKAPVMYLKPRNTISGDRSFVVVPKGADDLEIGATLGMVIGRVATQVPRDNAMEYVAGYTIVNDVCVPHDVFYRPSVRFRARDGFCPIGPRVVPTRDIIDPNQLAVRVYVDGKLAHETSTSDRVRDAAQLISDVSAMMTLYPGDILMLGVGAAAPRVLAGQVSTIEIDAIGRLENQYVAECAAA